MKLCKRLVCAALALMMLIGAVPAFAAEEPTAAGVNAVAVALGLMADGTTHTQAGDLRMPRAEVTYYPLGNAVKDVQTKMKNRRPSFSGYYYFADDTSLTDAQIEEYIWYMFDLIPLMAMEHTGKPNEGDYIAGHYYGYDAERSGMNYMRTDDGVVLVYLEYVFSYLSTTTQESSVNDKVQTIIKSLDLEGKSEYEKVVEIYKYITFTIKFAGTNVSTSYSKKTCNSALVFHNVMDQGFANTFYRLALEAGLDARIMVGTGFDGEKVGDHLWNIVKIGDVYYHVDCTLDSIRAENGEAYAYFLKTDETIGHTRSEYLDTEEFHAAYPMATEDYPVWESVGIIDLEGATISLGNSLTVSFGVDITKVKGTDNYAVITKSYADRDDVTVTVPQSQWFRYNTSSPIYLIPFTGVSAKEMGDELRVTIYNADGEAISNERTDTIKDYCRRMLDAEAERSAPYLRNQTLYVEILNYGAAAQTTFGYNTENLVNADLSDEEKGYVIKNYEMENIQQTGEGYVGATLSLKNEIILNFAIDQTMADKAAYAVATYTNHYSTAKSVTVEAAQFQKYSDGIYLVPISGMSVADYGRPISCTMYDAEGNELATYVDSVESYVARNADKGEIYTAIIRFATAAYSYFHPELVPLG